MKLLQMEEEDPNDMEIRIYQLIEVQQFRDHIDVTLKICKDKIKDNFDRKDTVSLFPPRRPSSKVGF